MISIIVAISQDYAIGKQGNLLCHMSADLKHFKEITMGHPILMGKNTWLSLPRRPLPGRRNIVVTHHPTANGLEGAETVGSIDEAISSVDTHEECFVIGGGMIYEQCLPKADKLYITKIHATFPDADTFFPTINPTEWELIEEERFEADEKNPYPYSFKTYLRKQ